MGVSELDFKFGFFYNCRGLLCAPASPPASDSPGFSRVCVNSFHTSPIQGLLELCQTQAEPESSPAGASWPGLGLVLDT